MTLLIMDNTLMTLLIMTTYNDNTYNDFTYNGNTCNTYYGGLSYNEITLTDFANK